MGLLSKQFSRRLTLGLILYRQRSYDISVLCTDFLERFET